MGSFVKEATGGSVHELMGSSKQLVVVRFWDPWCSVCTEMAPIFEEIANKYQGKAIFKGLNMRENPKTAGDLEIYITPTFIFFKDGKEVGRVGGLLEPKELEAEIERLI